MCVSNRLNQFLVIAASVVCLSSSYAVAQTTRVYRFEGHEAWPFLPNEISRGALPDNDVRIGGFTISNNTNATLFFDDNFFFVAPARADNPTAPGGVLVGDAMWADPLEGRIVIFGEDAELDTDFPPSLDFDFSALERPVNAISFDFAWTDISNPLYIEFSDELGDFASAEVELDGEFFGGFPGSMGHVNLRLDELEDELLDFTTMSIDLGPIGANTVPSNEQFAIDNLRIEFDRTDIGTNDSQLSLFDQGGELAENRIFEANYLRGRATPDQRFDIRNSGADNTTYDFTVAETYRRGTGVNVQGTPGAFQINGNANLVDGAIAVLDTFGEGAASGVYTTQIVLTNLENANDPDDVATVRINYFDPAVAIANTTQPVRPSEGGEIRVAAAEAEAPEELRAGVRMFGYEFSKPGYRIDDYFGTIAGSTQNYIEPGDEDTANVIFSPIGLLAGSYDGVLTIAARSSLSGVNGSLRAAVGDAELNDLVWNVEAIVEAKSLATSTLEEGTLFSKGDLYISSAVSAAAIVDGSTSLSQTVEMGFAANPEEGNQPVSAELIGSAVEVNFENSGDLFVLQLTYDDAELSLDQEMDLDLLFFDPDASTWVTAISENSDAGAGGTPFDGSYENYLADVVGGALTEGSLSDYGLDVEANQLWAVLDHNSLFAIGLSGGFNEDCNLDGLVTIDDANCTPNSMLDSFLARHDTVRGDTDGSGGVDFADFLTLAANFGADGANYSEGDFDKDGTVQFADFLILAGNFGTGATFSAASVSAVPEPSNAALALLAFLGLLLRRSPTLRRSQ